MTNQVYTAHHTDGGSFRGSIIDKGLSVNAEVEFTEVTRGFITPRLVLRGEFLPSFIKTDQVLNIGPIGSRQDFVTAVMTEEDIFINTGCFCGKIRDFWWEVSQKKLEDPNKQQYLELIEFLTRIAEIRGYHAEGLPSPLQPAGDD